MDSGKNTMNADAPITECCYEYGSDNIHMLLPSQSLDINRALQHHHQTAKWGNPLEETLHLE